MPETDFSTPDLLQADDTDAAISGQQQQVADTAGPLAEQAQALELFGTVAACHCASP